MWITPKKAYISGGWFVPDLVSQSSRLSERLSIGKVHRLTFGLSDKSSVTRRGQAYSGCGVQLWATSEQWEGYIPRRVNLNALIIGIQNCFVSNMGDGSTAL